MEYRGSLASAGGSDGRSIQGEKDVRILAPGVATRRAGHIPEEPEAAILGVRGNRGLVKVVASDIGRRENVSKHQTIRDVRG